MPTHPLAEVFGFPVDNLSEEATRYRNNRLCPFANNVPNCTKDKADNPLGVCSIFHDQQVVITCPIRFREGWLIAEDAARFLFPENVPWTTLAEVRLKDKHAKSAGNIDIVLVSYDAHGHVTDFGALEIQAVYISGNIRRPFEYYMEDPPQRSQMDWRAQANYPRPDYLSSSCKRLVPQLLFKGGIFHSWNNKTAIALNDGFYETLPPFEEVDESAADLVWLIYSLTYKPTQNRYALERHKAIYTKHSQSLQRITTPEPGELKEFVGQLQTKLDEKLDNANPPDTETIESPF